MNIYQKICQVTTPQERRRLRWLTVPVCLFALLNVVGVGVIMPFIAVAGDISLIHKYAVLSWIYQSMNFTQPQHFLIFLGSLCFAFLCFVNGCGALLAYMNARVTNDLSVSMATRLLNIYLHQPYQFFLNQHTANMGNRVLSMIESVKLNVIFNGINFISSSVVIISLIVLLMFSDLAITLLALFSLGVTYAFIYFFVRKKLVYISNDQVIVSQKMFKVVNEAFGGIKVLTLSGKQMHYTDLYDDAAVISGNHHAIVTCIQTMPRYLLEGVTFGGVVVMILWMLSTGQVLTQFLPTLAMFVYAGYRLLPASQNMMNAFATCKSSMGSLDTLCHDFSILTKEASHLEDADAMQAITLNSMLSLNHVSYTYPGCTEKVLDDVSIDIGANQIIGIIGTTGAGKTTLVDVILGLLVPNSGGLLVDGDKLEKNNIRSWQNQLGYVSQHIYLSDDTVAHNIAFGVDHRDIDFKHIEYVSKVAEIHDHVINNLPDAYNTNIGENGVRLSGGQRQRIGIARALYHNPSVLVLDEATSALDNVTEKKVMQEIYKLAGKKTIIIIAHRLSTVSYCDMVFMMRHGKVVDQGSCEQLIQRHELLNVT